MNIFTEINNLASLPIYLQILVSLFRTNPQIPLVGHNSDTMCQGRIFTLESTSNAYQQSIQKFWSQNLIRIQSDHLSATKATQYEYFHRDQQSSLTTNLFTDFGVVISNESTDTTSGPQQRHNVPGKNFYTGIYIQRLLAIYIEILESKSYTNPE